MLSRPSILPTFEGGSAVATGSWRDRVPRWFGPLAAAILVGAIVMAVHWPVLGAQALSFDDDDFVTMNPLVSHPSWTSAGRFFSEVLSPSTVRGYYLPLSMTSLMLDVAAGARPNNLRVFHRTSLALHVLTTILLLLILYRLLGALVPAALAGLLFGLHPLTVEPVAWIGERKTLLATFFAFACILAYVEWLRRKNKGWRIASVALHVLALLSKPTVTMLPLLLLLLDWWPLKRLRLRTVIEKWPYFLFSILSGLITIVSHQLTAGLVPNIRSGLPQWPARTGYLLAFYLRKIVWPTNLSCAYQSPAPASIANPVVLLSVIAVCALTGFLVLLARRARGPLTGWLFFVLAVAPTLGFVVYSWVIASDKYVYFPAFGILLVIAWALGVARNSRRLRGLSPRIALLAFLLLILGAETQGVRSTLRNWKDSLTLNLNMVRLAPDVAPVHMQLAFVLEGRSAREEAVQHLRRAVEIDPYYGIAQYNLAIGLASQGKIEEAITHFQRAIDLMPSESEAADVCFNLGMALRLRGRTAEAAEQFRHALQLNPNYLPAIDQLGSVLSVQGRLDEAVVQFQTALAHDSTDAVLHHKLGTVLLQMQGRSAEAAKHLRLAIRYKPDWPVPLNALAWFLATTPDPALRDPEEALTLATRAVALAGGKDPLTLDTQAAAEASAGHFDEASRMAQDAVRLATECHADSLAGAIRIRVALYERRVAYTEPPGGEVGSPGRGETARSTGSP
jgi:protein O-mannosyl-transferase